MTNVISQQDLLEQIVSVSMEIFQKTLASNPNEFSYDDERLDRHFVLSTQKFRCHIHRYEEKSPYYEIRFDLFYNMNPGFDRGLFLSISNAFGKATFYINDGCCGRVKEYDEEKVNNCFSIIYNVLSELIN